MNVVARWSAIIPIKIFLVVSSSVIGLVIFISPIQSFGFGIGYILPFFQSKGICSVVMILLKRVFKRSMLLSPRFCRSMYEISEGPNALFLFFSFITDLISAVSIGVMQFLYQAGLSTSLGSYCFCQSENSSKFLVFLGLVHAS